MSPEEKEIRQVDSRYTDYLINQMRLGVYGNAAVADRRVLLGLLDAERDRSRRLREALEWCAMECKVYAAHHRLELLAQRMFDRIESVMQETKPGDHK